MSKSLLTLFVASGVIALSGCKETKSEAWYKQHPDVRIQFIHNAS
ncbi:hypothetical protein Bresa_03248|uniref:Uncharacterized protein n=1 Tax=Brenneria salicis ATCC 15712 = DSM 30166 TaxID=714314 RepID=A0A366I0W8_9GAMM|nr:hypothetical protein [Brenneria salicis ATCC 15712 = DSM 30166]RBP60986.1 hypothetical protein DES54_12838 [Brenneria salicis ATCC 15712 = DSM 30166]